MLYFIMHYLPGYCLVEITGSGKERFLNLLAARQILIWRLCRSGNSYTFYISRRGCRELEEISAKTGCSYHFLSKKGLPYLFYRYRRRKCLALAALFSLAILCVLSRFIWKIDTVGCYSYSQEEMLDYLEEKGIYCGMPIRDLSCPELEEEIREDFEDISWVSCERKGTLLTVAVKEALNLSEDRQETIEPCNLIASKEGVIDSIYVRRGCGKVKKGMKVKKGDVLISGTVPLINDAGEVTEEAKVSADGDVIAVTKQAFQKEIPFLHTEKKYNGKCSKSFGLLVLGKYYDLPGFACHYSRYDTESEEYNLHIGPQLYLPFSLFIYTHKEYSLQEKRYSKEEAEKAMENRLAYFLAQYEAKGVEIIKNNVKIDCNESTCTATGTIMMKERLGTIQKI